MIERASVNKMERLGFRNETWMLCSIHSLIVTNEEGRSKRTKRGKGFQRWVFIKKFLSFFNLCCNEKSGTTLGFDVFMET